MTDADLKPYSTWRHRQTGSLYLVLGIAQCSTSGERENLEHSVLYVSLTHGALRYREISEFLDGRFTLVKGDLL